MSSEKFVGVKTQSPNVIGLAHLSFLANILNVVASCYCQKNNYFCRSVSITSPKSLLKTIQEDAKLYANLIFIVSL